MKIIEKIVKGILFRRDLKLLKGAFRENFLSKGRLTLKTNKIPVHRLLGVLTAYISSSDDNMSLIVPTEDIKQDIIRVFEGTVPCMTIRDFYNNIEYYSYEGKTFIFLPLPIVVQSEIYDSVSDKKFKILFCE